MYIYMGLHKIYRGPLHNYEGPRDLCKVPYIIREPTHARIYMGARDNYMGAPNKYMGSQTY